VKHRFLDVLNTLNPGFLAAAGGGHLRSAVKLTLTSGYFQ